MSFGTDGIVRQWQQDLGQDVVGIMKYPKVAEGNLAKAFNATQSISYFITSWSKNKEEAGAFLQFMHTPERMQRWYELTGVGLADKRFDASLVWLENYNPPQVDSEANLKAGQLIFSGSGTPQEAAQLWQSVAQRWRTQSPDDLKNWQSWHPEVSGA
jgi:raffinose/stachyose/melibiose transport system substrate-binding protein